MKVNSKRKREQMFQSLIHVSSYKEEPGNIEQKLNYNNSDYNLEKMKRIRGNSQCNLSKYLDESNNGSNYGDSKI